MRDGTERKSSSSSSPSPAPDCDVGLGLRMQLQPTDSYSCGGSGGGGGGGGAFFSSTSNPLGFMGEIYEAAAADRVVFPRGFHTSSFTASGGGIMQPVCGKALFTYSQWQELERQKMIHKYIMASIPVPPQLLLPTVPSPNSLSQSNSYPVPGQQDIGGRYPTTANGSDPEGWRCKRTDGKKWRCSRDVAPDQKYCERHAHKSRPRSRKHVEISSSHTNTTTNNNNVYSSHLQPFQRSTTTSNNFPAMAAPSSTTASFDQTRSIEWFMRGGSSNSTCNKQQQLMHRDSNIDQDKNNMSVLHEQIYDENKKREQAAIGFMSLSNNNIDPYNIPESNKTRRFIDAWGNNKDGIFEKGFSSSSSSNLIMREKFSPSSLSLSMSAGNGIGDLEYNNNNNNSSSNNNDRSGNGGDGMLKPQWMMMSQNNPAVSSWMNDTSAAVAPGGPLGEALCLGGNFASSSSPHININGYYSNANSSSCSKSSCDDDATNALNFIG